MTRPSDHSAEALLGAIADLDGPPGIDHGVDHHLQALGRAGWNHVFGAMAGWVEVMRTAAGDLPGEGWGVAAVDAATGRRVNPEGRVIPQAIAAGRIIAALLNDQEETAWALLLAAVEAGQGEDVTVLVLHQAAQAIRAHQRP